MSENCLWCDCVQRNLKIAEELKREAEKKRADAVRLAKEWEQAKNDAQKAAQARYLSPSISQHHPTIKNAQSSQSCSCKDSAA